MDVDLRKLRYFVAVAEELHFGRAAEHLHIAQPVLSRQIRSLEGELGTELFVRNRRGTQLSAAGEQLLRDARPLLTSAAAMVRRMSAAAGEPVLTIGFMPGIILTSVARLLRRRHPGTSIRLLRTDWHDQVRVLHDGRADVGVVRLPVDRTGLEVRPLFSEPRVAVVPSGHPLGGKESLRIADLAAEHLLQDPDAVPEWRDVAVEVREGRRAAVPVIRSIEEKLELVAGGEGIALIPVSTAAFYTRQGIALVPVDDLPPGEVALAWEAGRQAVNPLIEEFAGLAAEWLPERERA